MGSHTLGTSQCEKDIGVYIDSKLKFDEHINHAINKCNRLMAITKKTFECMDKPMFKYIFKGLIRPQLEYAAPVWSPYTIKQKEAIENIQRRATKLIPGFYDMSYPERL